MKKKTILRIVLAVLAAAILGGCLPADVEALDLHFSFIKFTRNKVDFENKTVTSRFLWGKSVAAYRDGYGVTLLRGKKAAALQAEKYPLAPEAEGPDFLAPGDSALTERLAPIAKALVDDHAYNGTPFAFVVLHEGKVVAERYREGITARTRLLSWSMAKSFTNALAGIMSGDGMVDIYAPTGIPEWQGDERATITLNDLMQMQSGLQWNEDYGNRSDVNLMLHREKDMGLYALDKPLEHKPGTFWYYSSGSTNIVMRYLRGKFASDKEFLTYYRERLFAPLGIHNPVFEPDMSGTPVGSSYLYITAREFASLGQLYLDDGVFQGQRILPEVLLAEQGQILAGHSRGHVQLPGPRRPGNLHHPLQGPRRSGPGLFPETRPGCRLERPRERHHRPAVAGRYFGKSPTSGSS